MHPPTIASTYPCTQCQRPAELPAWYTLWITDPNGQHVARQAQAVCQRCHERIQEEMRQRHG